MSVECYYGLCQKYKGRAVEVRTRDGRTHRGIIESVDRRMVYIRPHGAQRNLGGFGFGYYGGYGYGRIGFGIALGFITGLVLAPLFFW